MTRARIAIGAALVALLAPGPQGQAGGGPLGTGTTYQGRLQRNGVRVDDLCDLEFGLFDSLSGGVQIGPTLTFDGLGGNPAPIDVVDGLLTVTLDFGPDAFEGDARFVEIAVRCPSGSGAYEPLAPRQPVSAAPYALYALDSPASFNLPLEATIDRPETAFDITNAGGGALAGTTGQTNAVAIYGTHTGSGRSGLFENLNIDNVANVLEAFTNSAGDALVAVTNGLGRAARFELANPASTAPAVEAVANGINSTLLVGATGTGDAGEFEIRNPASAGNALRALTNGTGAAVISTSVGTASAGDFAITNAASTADALVATTNGSGAGVTSTNTGTGPAGEFVVPAPGNNVPALVGWQFGNGQAANFTSGVGLPISQATVSGNNFRLSGHAGEFSNNDPNNVDPTLWVDNFGLNVAGVFRASDAGAGQFFSAADPNQPPVSDPTLYVQNDRARQSVAEFRQQDPNNTSPAVVIRDAGDDAYALDVAGDGGLARFVSTSFFSHPTLQGVDIQARTMQNALRVTNSSTSGELALFEQVAPGSLEHAVLIDVKKGGAGLRVDQTGDGGAARFRRNSQFEPNNPLGPLDPVVEIIRDPNAFLDGQPALKVVGGVDIQTAEPVGLRITHQGGQALNVTASLGSPIGAMTGDSDNVPALLVKNTGTMAALHVEGSAINAPGLSVFGNVDFIGDEFSCSASAFFGAGVQIGQFSPGTGLSVCGDATIDGALMADSVTQTNVTVCADYVFEPNYPLMPLSELRAFLAREKHLPHVPSEAEIKAAGAIDLGDFQMRLLEKIEELTLYTLQQDEQFAGQQDQLAALKNENAALRERLTAIEAALAAGLAAPTNKERQP